MGQDWEEIDLMKENNKPKFEAYDMDEYPSVKEIKFPNEIHIAFAVCGKECGNKEFIVDGQSQVCQYCGRLMFRTEIEKYIIESKNK
jgi:hypothetical protein